VRITGEPLDDHPGRQPLQNVADPLGILLRTQGNIIPPAIEGFQGGVADNIEQVELDPVEPQAGQLFGGGDHLLTALAGEPEDDVGADSDAPAPGGGHGPAEAGQIMAPVDPGQGLIGGRLEAVLDPDQPVRAPGISLDEVEGRPVHAVRPGADGQPDHRRVGHGRVIELPEPVQRGVGVGKGLEIGDKPPGLIPLGHCRFAPADLVGYRQAPGEVPGPRSPIVAIDTPARPDGPVPVGTGEAGVDGDLLDPASEDLP